LSSNVFPSSIISLLKPISFKVYNLKFALFSFKIFSIATTLFLLLVPYIIFILNSIPFSLRSKGTHRNESLEFEAYLLYNISREYTLQSTVGGVADFCNSQI